MDGPFEVLLDAHEDFLESLLEHQEALVRGDLESARDLIALLQADLLTDFFEGFARGARANVHLKVLYGRSDHHKVEALFKALARALDAATKLDERRNSVASTKGTLTK